MLACRLTNDSTRFRAMYWPVGAPRIYAASNKAAQGNVLDSDDDAESRETTEGSGSLVDAPYFDSDEQRGEEERSGRSTPVTPITPGIKPVEHDHQPHSTALLSHDVSASRESTTQPLLALRTSRTGQLFAVITTTTLTIWQTKVKYASLFADCF